MAKIMSKGLKRKLVAPCMLLVGCVLSASIGMSMVANTFAVSADTDDTTRTYTSSYSSKDDVTQAALELNTKVAEEGMVLFENDGVLPLKTSKGKKTKVTVFGYNAAEPAIGGDQSADDTSAGVATADSDVYETLENAGYAVNPTVAKAYRTWKDEAVTEETTQTIFGMTITTTTTTYPYGTDKDIAAGQADGELASWDSMKDSFNQYGDAAIVVLGTTGYDTSSVTNEYRYKYDEDGNIIGTSLTLDDEQLDLVQMAADNFSKVIVVINSATPVEMGELDDMYQDGTINAIIQCSEPGDGGLTALGSFLKGEVSPSGHTGDIWARDFTHMSSFANYTPTQYVSSTSTDDVTGETTESLYSSYFTEYEEGIYIGYRYYETVAHELTDGEDWYGDQVVYPFGYGLSYTDFSYEIVSSDVPTAVTSGNMNKTMTVKVRVTNTGDYAGKGVVQLYYESPYTDYDKENGVEKSYVVLGDYAKTDTLQPGACEIVDVKISAADMASYDENTAKTYILDAGEYNLKVMTDSHTEVCADTDENMSFSISDLIKVSTSSTGTEVTNQFDDSTEYMAKQDTLSRADMEGKSSSDWDVTEQVSASKPTTVVRDDEGNFVSAYTDKTSNTRYTYLDDEETYTEDFTNYTLGDCGI